MRPAHSKSTPLPLGMHLRVGGARSILSPRLCLPTRSAPLHNGPARHAHASGRFLNSKASASDLCSQGILKSVGVAFKSCNGSLNFHIREENNVTSTCRGRAKCACPGAQMGYSPEGERKVSTRIYMPFKFKSWPSSLAHFPTPRPCLTLHP